MILVVFLGWGRTEIHTVKERHHLEYLVVGGRIILKGISNRMRMW
jgi:hypothetical protein